MGRGASHSSGGGGIKATSLKDVEKQLSTEESTVLSRVGKETAGMLTAYTDDAYGAINDYLRGISDEIDHDMSEYFTPEDIIGGIDNTISAFNLNRSLSVTRTSDSWILGTQSVDRINNMKGRIITNRAYTSTSIGDSSVFKSKGNVDYVISIPKGKGRGAYVGSRISSHLHEHEFVLKRNTQFRVDGAIVHNGRRIVHLTVVN